MRSAAAVFNSSRTMPAAAAEAKVDFESPDVNCLRPSGFRYGSRRAGSSAIGPMQSLQDASTDRGLCFRIRGLTKTYGSGHSAVHALRGVDLELPDGELVVLLGASGSGKSTLLNIIGGLDRPTSGQFWFRGSELSGANQRELTEYRRQHVGFVFQFYNLMASLTAKENVALVTEIAENPLPPDEALALVGLEERVDHFPSQLSGGEQQRVAIARAIAKQPSVLLCDEPTGALDSATGILVLEALKNVNAKMGATTLLITHNAGVADMADRVIILADGNIKEVRRNENPIEPSELSW
jgi:putative ABC transport system ATP-binding protein